MQEIWSGGCQAWGITLLCYLHSKRLMPLLSVRHSGRTALPSQPPSILPRAKDEKRSLYPELRHLDHPECKGV